MRSSLARFLPYVRPYRYLILIASAAGVVRYVVPLFVPWAIKIIIDSILTPTPPHDALPRLRAWFLFLAAGYAVFAVASYVRLTTTGLAGNRIIFDLRRDLFVHLQKMSLRFYEKHRTGAVISRLIGDIAAAQDGIGNGVTSVLMDITSVAVIAVMMLLIHVKLALVSLGLVPAYIFFSKWVGKKIRRTSRRVQDQMEHLSGNLHEKVEGMAVVQSFTREKEEEALFLRDCRAVEGASLENIRQQALGLSLIGWLIGITPVFVLWVGARDVLSGTLTVGGLMAFYAYVGLLYAPVARLTELHVVIVKAVTALDRIFEFFDAYPEVSEKKNAAPLQNVRGKITFRGVSFAYEGRGPVLDHVSFEICPGEFVVLAGPSGAGKSTIASLLLRFYDPQEGEILLDDVNLRDCTLASLRNQAVLVSQHPILFSGTILQNILYGRKDATEEEAVQAAQAAHAHEFIRHLPDQYETEVGERGGLLSIGQKQRIALARAFLKKAPVLLLDEPTSALDPLSASLIMESLRDFKGGRTVLMIAHNPSVLEGADRVLELSHGRLREPHPFSYIPG